MTEGLVALVGRSNNVISRGIWLCNSMISTAFRNITNLAGTGILFIIKLHGCENGVILPF
jgi:hypothetical protein